MTFEKHGTHPIVAGFAMAADISLPMGFGMQARHLSTSRNGSRHMQKDEPRRLAYADPPYLGCSHFYDHPDAAIWDDKETHIQLITAMDQDFHGWAYSCNSSDLLWLGPHLPAGVRIASWVKPFAAFKRNVPIAYTWEPVIFRRALPRRESDPIGRDHLAEGITMKRGFTGAKPDKFNRWVLDLIAYQDGDVMHDFFPGTDGMSRTLDADVLPLDFGALA